jgi:hypothetical protein
MSLKFERKVNQHAQVGSKDDKKKQHDTSFARIQTSGDASQRVVVEKLV